MLGFALKVTIVYIALRWRNHETILPYRWSLVNVSHDLLCELLPGPVTVVFERSPSLNPGLNPGTTLVGIRVPDSGFIRDVTRACKGPLALTSANISNAPSAVSIEVSQGYAMIVSSE